MSPHNDAPSPMGRSFSPGYNRLSSSGLATNHQADSLSSSCSSLDMADAVCKSPRPLLPGVYVPTTCFFDAATEDLDTASIAQHAVRLARAGITGLTTQGSNGEAVHLSHAERRTVTATTRSALDSAGFSHMPLIVGCGAQSVRETIEFCREAATAGGDYALILPPSYYAPLFAPAAASVIRFFEAVADASPIPVLIYNYPGAVSGMDLSSETIIELSSHANIVGVKLTCGNTGKLNRIVAATKSRKSVTSNGAPPFIVLGGSADFTLQTLVGGGHGILAGLANLAPRACLELMRLWKAGEFEKAQAMQEIVARGDWAAIQGGIVSTKAALQAWHGYGGFARAPLPRPSKEESIRWKEGFKELIMLERTLDVQPAENNSESC